MLSFLWSFLLFFCFPLVDLFLLTYFWEVTTQRSQTTPFYSVYTLTTAITINVVNEFWQKAASHIVPLLKIEWFFFAAYTAADAVIDFFFAAVHAVLTENLTVIFKRAGQSPKFTPVGSRPTYNSWFLRPARVEPPNGISLCSPTHRHTDRATCNICRNMPHLS